MKKAVISTGNKQYLVEVGQTIEIDYLKSADKTIKIKPNLVIQDDKTSIGQPLVEASEVSLEIVEPEKKADKVVAIRYKAKKRVKKVRGHRQKQTVVKVLTIK